MTAPPASARPSTAPDTAAPAEALAAELVALVRGLRELGSSMPSVDGQRLDVPAAAVLGHVGDAGPLRLSALAERLFLDVSTVSRQVPALERAGWLVREPDPCDRRATLLRLSERGQQALAARRRAYADVLAGALPGWGQEELRDLAASLSRLNADLAAHRSASVADARPAPAHQEAS